MNFSLLGFAGNAEQAGGTAVSSDEFKAAQLAAGWPPEIVALMGQNTFSSPSSFGSMFNSVANAGTQAVGATAPDVALPTASAGDIAKAAALSVGLAAAAVVAIPTIAGAVGAGVPAVSGTTAAGTAGATSLMAAAGTVLQPKDDPKPTGAGVITPPVESTNYTIPAIIALAVVLLFLLR